LIVKVQRTGGFAGMPTYSEMNSDDLPINLKATLTKLAADTMRSSKSSKSLPKGAADHYSYSITVDDGANQQVIECSQYDIQDDLKSIIKYVEQHSKNKSKL